MKIEKLTIELLRAMKDAGIKHADVHAATDADVDVIYAHLLALAGEQPYVHEPYDTQHDESRRRWRQAAVIVEDVWVTIGSPHVPVTVAA